MNRFLRSTLLACSFALVTGCASGPRLRDAPPAPAPQSGPTGRVFFYRTTAFGAGLRPKIRLNGENVGRSVARGVFYVDRPAGDYEVAVSTEVTRKVTFTLAPGDVKYVRFTVHFGILVGRVVPEVVDPDEAATEIGNLHLVAANVPGSGPGRVAAPSAP